MPVGKIRPRTVMTPGDFGDSRARNAYKKAGPCIAYKIGEVSAVNDGALKSLAAMPFDLAREAGLNLCKEMSDSQLKRFWSVPLSYVRRMRYLLGIEKDRQGTIYIRGGHSDKWPPTFRRDGLSGDGNKHATAQSATGALSVQTTVRDTNHVDERTGIALKQDRCASKSFTLSFNGIFYADDLKSRIDAVKALLCGSPDSKYAINVSLQEIGKENGANNTAEHRNPEALSG